jgi:hypothetical protein
MKENPECKVCFLHKETVDSFDETNRWYKCKDGKEHDFGEDLKLCHICNTMKHIRNGTICQGCVVEMSDTGTIKLYTDEGAVKQIIEKIKNTKFPVGERKWCSKCEENIINVIKSI